jgi:mRNA interferase RelE/StbE
MKYKIEIQKKAEKFLDRIPKIDAIRIREEIESLAENPRKHGVIKLKDSDPSEYRTKQGNYRIIFQINDNILMVLVIRIFIRGDEY